jgi:hypothetical protein
MTSVVRLERLWAGCSVVASEVDPDSWPLASGDVNDRRDTDKTEAPEAACLLPEGKNPHRHPIWSLHTRLGKTDPRGTAN